MTDPSIARLDASGFTSPDGTRFGHRQWFPANRRPSTIVIGVHGISGAAVDFENFGRFLQERGSPVGVIAYELRGQGNDPRMAQRGNIRHASLWFEDLETFTALVRRRHPGARIVWFGESMGSLIVLHAFSRAGPPPCDAIVLTSPVVSLGGHLPGWKKAAVRIAARAAPWARVSLEGLSGATAVQVTHDTIHQAQAAVTPWHVRHHTLRLLATLGRLIEGMPHAAGRTTVPVLVLHGGHDYLSQPEEIQRFMGYFPASLPATRRFYPDSYHLLMYDQHRDRMFADIDRWLSNPE